ncbi:hypothetical protein [Microbispora rosea]
MSGAGISRRRLFGLGAAGVAGVAAGGAQARSAGILSSAQSYCWPVEELVS